ncbi:RNA cytidine acetyltransferase, partial [Diplonema papillatum]
MSSTSTPSRRVDDRIKVTLENAAQSKHRSFLLLVGDHGREQVVNLHQMVSKAQRKSKVSVLWCYKKELSFGSSARHKRVAQFKKEVDRGISTAETNSAFEVFLAQNKIRFCYYKDTHKVLGQTFGMCVLQDFEALTPNLLARTVETVEGGGLIVVLIRTLKSLKQLYTLTMDVHARYRTSQHSDIVPRFNERFLLSLADCRSFLCVNDKLEVLPFTTNTRETAAALPKDVFTEEEKKLKYLQAELKANDIVGPLVQACVTLQQATSVLTMMEAITEKTLSTSATVTAGRGRGKSAALGLAAAGAVTQGYSNVFITAPTPENVQTLFEFVAKGLDAMGYTEREHYEVVQAEAAEMSNCVIRINVFKTHRQTIQYILPTDGARFGQAELVIIDEAAAIPLPLVKAIMGPYLVFLSSTVTGYEGTGRSLSLKLFSDLKKAARVAGEEGGRALKEITLTQPIRYGSNDPVEEWLNKVLCLDAALGEQNPPPVHPDQLELFYVNRDTLFSYHSV